MPTFPVNTGVRFDLSVDGTICNYKLSSSSTPVDVPSTQIATLMGASGATTVIINGLNAGGQYVDLNFTFPELRTMTGIRWSGWHSRNNSGEGSNAAYWSSDTTDGVNGTWNQIVGTGGGQYVYTDSIGLYRLAANIQAFNQSGVKGIRLRFNNSVNTGVTVYYRDVHFYGTRAITGDHLQFWDPTTDIPLNPGSFDYGDVVRGTTTAVRTFRIKNVSSTLTATAPAVNFGNYAGTAFSVGELSMNGTSGWGATQTLSNLAPGAISPLLYFRATTTAADPPQPRSGRLAVTAASWA